MSLRVRLTLLYSSLLGVVLVVFGVMAYTLVSVTLISQVDTSLADAANQIIPSLRVNFPDQFDISSVASIQPAENLLLQIWGADRNLQVSRPASLQTPLDPSAQTTSQITLRSIEQDDTHLRVLSVPLETARGPAGVMQIGVSLEFIDVTQNTMMTVLGLFTFGAVLLAGLACWMITGQTLAPLATMTNVATRITRADDLSSRIPVTKNSSDEVGQLIQAFNSTLERLEQLFTSQRRFLADVSHDLRTPLTVIKGNVSLMRKMKDYDEESLSTIEQEADRLTRLVGDLLLLAQAESGKMPLDIRTVDLDALILEVFQQTRTLAGDRLDVRMGELELLQVKGDRDRLKQAILNLAGNAVQYTRPGGWVSLALCKNGNQAQIVVSDNGPGISQEDLPHIFERFYRGQKSRTHDRSSGFGLGLSIAYWIIRNHGGSIDVTSKEGVGTTFSIWLPLEEADATTPLKSKKS